MGFFIGAICGALGEGGFALFALYAPMTVFYDSGDSGSGLACSGSRRAGDRAIGALNAHFDFQYREI
jgi:hypothetical protein